MADDCADGDKVDAEVAEGKWGAQAEGEDGLVAGTCTLGVEAAGTTVVGVV